MASHCEFCGTAFWPYLKKCKGCHTVYYCDRDCQTQDWKYHKISCSGDVIRKAIEDSSMASHSSKTPRPLRVSKIPDKVWFRIFEFLSTKDMVLGIAFVCKHFNKLFKSPKMPIKKITLSISDNSKLLLNRKARQNAFMAIERARCLETLIIDDGLEVAGVTSWLGYKEHLNLFRQQDRAKSMDHISVAYYLSGVIKNCPKLRHVELHNIHHISEDYLVTLGPQITKRINQVKKGWNEGASRPFQNLIPGLPGRPEKYGNNMWLIALALECKNLETLIIEDLDNLKKTALATLLSERKDTLKYLRISGKSILGDSLKHLPGCHRLEKLEICCAWNLGVSGFESISKMKNLTSLELSFAQMDMDGEDTGLRSRHLVELFDNKNLEFLEKLSLAGSDLVDCREPRHDRKDDQGNVDDKAIKTIALNCPRLKYIDLYKGQNIADKSFSFLIENLQNLSYLSVRKCYEVDVEYLLKAVKKSKSPCLKINTWKGIITWESEIKEVRFDFWKKGVEGKEDNLRDMRRRFVFGGEKTKKGEDPEGQYAVYRSGPKESGFSYMSNDAVTTKDNRAHHNVTFSDVMNPYHK